MNMYLKGSGMSTAPLLFGTHRLSQTEQYQKTDPIKHCTIKKENTHLLIDVGTANDSNFITIETEKLSKYKDPEIEFSRMCKVRTEIVPVIIRAFGTIKK
jgi:hypothetical protein